jgi:hypothetical protein
MDSLRRRIIRFAVLATAVVVAATAAGSASGGIVQRLDFETANFNQWTEVQSACTAGGYDVAGVGNSCASIVTSPRREGTYAARFKISGWTDGTSTSPRAEAYIDRTATAAVEGQDWYYAWSTMFPSAENTGWWAKGGDWNYFTQMHGTGSVGAIFALGVDATGTTPSIYYEHLTKDPNNLSIDLKIEKTVLGPIRYDHWYDFVMHVRWSASGTGVVEFWVDGTKWLTQSGVTLPPGGAYLKQGYYGGAHGGTNVVYHDAMRRASSLSDVLAAVGAVPVPVPAPLPVEPTPVPAPAPAPAPVPATPKPKPVQKPKPKARQAQSASSGSAVRASTSLRWDGRTFTSARVLRSALGARGVAWEPFLRSHPGVAAKFGLAPVRWRGLVYYSRAALARRLGSEGVSYRRFASRHASAAARLQRNDSL